MMSHRIAVNGELHLVDAAPDTPLLYVLRNDLGLNGPKFGCGLGSAVPAPPSWAENSQGHARLPCATSVKIRSPRSRDWVPSRNLTLCRDRSSMSKPLNAGTAPTA
jgi:hypothetical protein